ncbi:MAG: GFA family protein [Gemmatimonas sp.]
MIDRLLRCEHCGSPVYSTTVDNRQTYSLRVGALRQRDEVGRPAREIWTRRRLPWVEPLEEVPQYDKQT